MAKTRTHSPKQRTPGFTLGRLAFAQISAVEGIRLTPEMEQDLREYDRKGFSASKRRTAIFEKYAKAR